MPRTRTETMAFKVAPEFELRLVDAAKRTRLSKSALAIAAVEAALRAIERHDGRIVLPIRFEVSDIPVDLAALSSEEHRQLAQILHAEDDRRGVAPIELGETDVPTPRPAPDAERPDTVRGSKATRR